MSDYVIDLPPRAVLPVDGGGLFPVRRIFCVGRNYAAHTREMGGDPDRELPFFFTKPADAVLTDGADMPYPPRASPTCTTRWRWWSHWARAAWRSPRTGRWSACLGYAAGLDMTRRDLQAQAKKEGKPWDMGKGFDHSAPVGLLVPARAVGHPSRGRIVLTVNGEVRQDSGPVAHDLVGAGDDRVPVAAGRAGARRPDLQRHARRRGRGATRRPAGGRVEGVGSVTDADRLMTACPCGSRPGTSTRCGCAPRC